MATVAFAPRTGEPAPLIHRKSVRKLDARQLGWLRDAFAAIHPIDDERGFQFWAGIHGAPAPAWCIHHQATPLFLPWHRAYLYFLELALRDRVPEARLPWWDWTSEASQADGIPEAFAAEEVDGEPNPLHSAEVARAQRRPGWPERTFREPGAFAAGLPTAAEVETALATEDFGDFTQRIEELHDRVHMWVAGTMAQVDFAAYDPIFWAHHAMVDRVWRLWQQRHPAVTFPDRLLDTALRPFEMTVRETLDPTALGYDYAGSTTRVEAPGTATQGSGG